MEATGFFRFHLLLPTIEPVVPVADAGYNQAFLIGEVTA